MLSSTGPRIPFQANEADTAEASHRAGPWKLHAAKHASSCSLPERLIGFHDKKRKASAAELLNEGILGEAFDPIGCDKPECRYDLVLVAIAVVPSFGEELLRRLVRLHNAVRPLGLPIDA